VKNRYRCLVLDHDDTVVDSTAKIHFPAFVKCLRQMRPDKADEITCEDYFRYNFHPGFIEMCKKLYDFTDEELLEETEIWKAYVKEHIPTVYPGMKEIIWDFKNNGGIIVVISHSFDFNIRRDYEANKLPVPDEIFGWECSPENRKPSVYGPSQVASKYGLKPEEMVMVDDLKPGYDMAKAFGMPFIGAGWSNDIPEIESFMRENSSIYLKDTLSLRQHLFE